MRWANTWRDATSVYGYSGPLCSHKDIPRAVVDGFQRDLIAALQELQVVSVFSRLHPLLPAQTTLLDGLGDHQFDGVTVSINLSATPPSSARSMTARLGTASTVWRVRM